MATAQYVGYVARRALGVCLVATTWSGSPGSAQAGTILFVVGEAGRPVHFDSYVLPLSAETDIAHARDLIARGTAAGAPIAIARIAPGADGVNADLILPVVRPWTWHITEFVGFADLGIELYDGWPTFVEQDVDGWMRNTGGYVGFWGYTVIAELRPVPEPTGLVLLALGALVVLPGALRQSKATSAIGCEGSTLHG